MGTDTLPEPIKEPSGAELVEAQRKAVLPSLAEIDSRLATLGHLKALGDIRGEKRGVSTALDGVLDERLKVMAVLATATKEEAAA